MGVRLGPDARALLTQLALRWDQGEHVLITGGTGSGKTALARHLAQIRLDRGGSVVIMLAKLGVDSTITEDYKGFKRWKTWKKKPRADENKIVFWPDVEGKTATEAKAIMRAEYENALNEISRIGKWTVIIDEGLFTTSASGLNQADIISALYQLIRSSGGTMITLAQRPAHLPLSVYANSTHAFVGQAREPADLKRLANLDVSIPSRQMAQIIANNGRHDFLVLSTKDNIPPQRLNLAK